MNKNIAIGIVTYGECESLIPRLQKATEAGYVIYLFDNSPEIDQIRKFCYGAGKNLIKYMTCGKNVGLGFGISSVCAQAYYESHKALLFFDQDTIFNISTLDFIESFYIKNPSIILEYSLVVFNAKNKSTLAVKDVVFAISSGSLFFLENTKKINWHNENYFVDCVDYEFCLRSNNLKFKIGECSMTPGFDHQSEQADRQYFIFGQKRMLRKYSSKRMKDTITASVKLITTSLVTGNRTYFFASLKSFLGYCFWQILVRLIYLFNPKSGMRK